MCVVLCRWRGGVARAFDGPNKDYLSMACFHRNEKAAEGCRSPRRCRAELSSCGEIYDADVRSRDTICGLELSLNFGQVLNFFVEEVEGGFGFDVVEGFGGGDERLQQVLCLGDVLQGERD